MPKGRHVVSGLEILEEMLKREEFDFDEADCGA